MLNFNGANFLGLHGRVETGLPKLQTQRTKFAGITGESEIVMGAGGRALKCQVWVSDASLTTAAAVAAYVESINQNVGVNSALIVTGANPDTFADCTFEGFEPADAIKPALGAGLPAGTYWVAGTLHWYQLTV